MNFANKRVVQFYRNSKIFGYIIVLHDTQAETPKTPRIFLRKAELSCRWSVSSDCQYPITGFFYISGTCQLLWSVGVSG
jgi:hypothetical protein